MKRILVRDYCKAIRTKSGLSTNDFAKERNVMHTYILDVENGKYDAPSIAKLIKLVNVYGLTGEDLMKTTVDPYFIQKLQTLNSVNSARYSLKSVNEPTNDRLINFANTDLKKNGYNFENGIELEAKQNLKYHVTVDIDENGYSIPIYDGKGTNKYKEKCYLYFLPNFIGEPCDRQILAKVINRIDVVISSIKNSNEVKPNEKFEIIFLTSSAKIFKQAKKVKEKNLDRNPKIDIVYLKKPYK